MAKKIKRSAEGLEVTCYTEGWPNTFYIEDETGSELTLLGRERAEGLHYALGKVLASAPKS